MRYSKYTIDERRVENVVGVGCRERATRLHCNSSSDSHANTAQGSREDSSTLRDRTREMSFDFALLGLIVGIIL
jgi:hypothetical protein